VRSSSIVRIGRSLEASVARVAGRPYLDSPGSVGRTRAQNGLVRDESDAASSRGSATRRNLLGLILQQAV